LINQTDIADLILKRLVNESTKLSSMFAQSQSSIGYFYLDELLPVELANTLYNAFPHSTEMVLKKSWRENKYIAAQMDQYNPLLEATIYAFQDPRVVSQISKICTIESLYPDHHLYNGGISLMQQGQYLNPHLDNSHDKDRQKWRALNLLYYTTPDWQLSNGGNLELWPNGVKQSPTVIHSKFNRLVVMATHNNSWHSVSPLHDTLVNRTCVSNYYFSDSPIKTSDRFHVTSFRGRPEQPLLDLILRADIKLRTAIRWFFKKGIIKNKHIYKK